MEKWEAYGDPDKVTDCEEKIHFCINEISRVEQTKMLIIGGAVTAAIICGLAAFLFIRRRKKHAETQ
ncbi:MAG: LPXTG cell wall anchor domain-containing protein [Theionarchaea archaeon]|nr:LPXTG cell wall anchor domain-containing protein [Theionarchaea archaeon]